MYVGRRVLGLETIFLAPTHEKLGRSLLALLDACLSKEPKREKITIPATQSNKSFHTTDIKDNIITPWRELFHHVWSVNLRIFLRPQLGFDNVPK
jgi:hypothetical protein